MAPTKEAIEKAFAKADTDDNGKLSMDEFKAVMIELAEDEEEREQCKNEGFLDMVMMLVDGDGDKMLTCDELMNLINAKEGDETQMLRNMLNGADKDGDGYLTAAELKAMMMKMDPDDDDVDMTVNMIIRLCDTDGSKKVKPEEVVSYMTNGGPKEKDPKEEAKMMFKMFDSNTDGFISKKELAGFLKEMAGDDDEDDSMIRMMSNVMLASADEDEDGKLNYEEFSKMMDDQ
eukprot:TRINITY_DN43090_c0_g1_i1.p1 TRINITY_DN43090_c0_g1~~TRINITY_DN43090_c0_g1_i1.p1  ORF type:complete len:232 (+),score=83.81 TRINITY_DN43090_c0_g1_i1:26-721(+)